MLLYSVMKLVLYTVALIISQPRNITGILPLSQYQDCNISIVFSNDAGNSESLVYCHLVSVYCVFIHRYTLISMVYITFRVYVTFHK